MSALQWMVDILGLAFIAWIVWYFWLYKRKGIVAAESSGVQEVRVRVKGGYDPDVIVVKAGRPVRLRFYREEEASCSEMVLFNELGESAKLPAFQDTVVEVTPPKPGEYAFQCQMGMIRGKLIAQ